MTRARDKARHQDLNGTELILDADADTSITADTDDQIDLKIANVDVANLTTANSGDLVISTAVSDKDFVIKGNDGGSAITALTLDMSGAGAASFNNTVTANAGVIVDNITIDGTEIDLSSGDLTLDVAGDIVLDAGGDEVIFKDGSTNVGHVSLDSDNLTIKSLVSDKDMIFQGNDGGSGITALTLDMSAAGAATFNNDVTAFSDERLKENIETIPNALDKVCQMRGVTFNRTDFDGEKQMGVIAQEVEKIIPEVVKEDDSEDKIKSVAYGNMVGVLIEAVKELKAEIEELKHDNKE